MGLFELIRDGVPMSAALRIETAEDPIKRLMRLGLPMKTIRHIYDPNPRKPYTNFRGTAPRRRVTDLRGHHLTKQEPSAWYAFNYPVAAARLAAKVLKKKRTKASMRFDIISPPDSGAEEDDEEMEDSEESEDSDETEDSDEMEDSDETIYFEETEDGAEMEDSGESEYFEETEDGAEMEDFDESEYFEDCFPDIFDAGPSNTKETGSNHDIYIGGSQNDGEVEFEMESTDSTTEELDDYDIEMAKAEEDLRSKELAEGDTERTPVSFSPVNQEKPERLTKRKREAESRESPDSDLSGDFDRDEKRRKLERAANSSQVSLPRLRKEERREKGGRLSPHDLFCQASSLAAVFQAVVEDHSLPPELDAIDLELLGEEPSGSENFKVVITEALDPMIGHDDLRVANAAANLLDNHQGNSNAPELNSVDREALKNALGKSDEVQPPLGTVEAPSLFVEIPRTVRMSERCAINQSLMRKQERTFNCHDKRIGPSDDFRSFFATRRLRRDLLLRDASLWDDEDLAFILSRRKVARIPARLGAEFVAKSLLDGRRTPLRRVVRDSQKSLDERGRSESKRSDKKVPPKVRRMLAQIKRSGLSTLVAEG